MTVKELIEELQKLDPNLRVISPIDDEGNGYRWPRCVSDDAYLLPQDAEEYRPEHVFEASEAEYLREDYEIELSEMVRVAYVG